jgi:hypothetical protein
VILTLMSDDNDNVIQFPTRVPNEPWVTNLSASVNIHDPMAVIMGDLVKIQASLDQMTMTLCRLTAAVVVQDQGEIIKASREFLDAYLKDRNSLLVDRMKDLQERFPPET